MALSHQPFLLVITFRSAGTGLNKVNGLANRSRAAGGPLLARCDNALRPYGVQLRNACFRSTPAEQDRQRRESLLTGDLLIVTMGTAVGVHSPTALEGHIDLPIRRVVMAGDAGPARAVLSFLQRDNAPTGTA
jgi:hypothetical protein